MNLPRGAYKLAPIHNGRADWTTSVLFWLQPTNSGQSVPGPSGPADGVGVGPPALYAVGSETNRARP